jgi:hypothetical protein
VRAACVLLVAAACSVPDVSLDGKHCPCASGYQCDTVTNTCKTTLGDGGFQPTCIGTTPAGLLYSDSFDSGTLDWTTTAMWAESGGVLEQKDATDPLAFAFPNASGGAASATEYRIVAKMTGTAGGTAMGVSFRIQAGQKAQYDCLWEPGAGAGALVLRSTNAGGQPTTIGTTTGIANPGPETSYTMEVLAQSGSFTCCLDGLASAIVTSGSSSYPTGVPGLVTSQMHATFDDFAVYAN